MANFRVFCISPLYDVGFCHVSAKMWQFRICIQTMLLGVGHVVGMRPKFHSGPHAHIPIPMAVTPA